LPAELNVPAEQNENHSLNSRFMFSSTRQLKAFGVTPRALATKL
jgi:hypothetical protein